MCQMSPVRCRSGGNSNRYRGTMSSGASKNSSQRRVAWRLKIAKLNPSPHALAPSGRGNPVLVGSGVWERGAGSDDRAESAERAESVDIRTGGHKDERVGKR